MFDKAESFLHQVLENFLFASFSFGLLTSGVGWADFTPEEIELLIEAGALPVGLGQRRLRVETAAIAILTTVMLLSEGYPVDLKSEEEV